MKENKLNIPLESIIAYLPGHVYWLDRNNVYLGCNDLQAKSAGLKSRHEIVGKTNYDLPWREHAEIIDAVNNKVLSTGQEYTVEETATMVDGKESVYLSKKVPLFDEDSNVVGLLGVSFDITEKKEYDKKLIAAKENADIALENIIAHLPGNVYWLDRNHVYLGGNTVQALSAGLKNRHEIVGKTNYDMPWRDQAEAFNAINDRVINTGQEYSVEEIAKQANGEERIFLSKKVPLLDNSKNIIGSLGISFDITKQKETEKELIRAKEEAEAANKLKSEFVLNMEHDIRTPFVGILGMTKILDDFEVDPAKKQIIADISSCAQELLEYSCAILDFSEVEKGYLPIISKKLDFMDLMKSIENIETPAAKTRNLNFIVECDNDIPNTIIGDEYRLKRILINLLSNSIKFTQKGFVKLSIKCLRKKGENIILRFIVEDSGIGIDEEKLNTIYEKFSRLTPSNQGIYKGQGLGLRIVKQFVEDMEGDIEIKSTLGVGTSFICTFSFQLPLIERD